MPDECKHKSLTRLLLFAGPWVTSVGGTHFFRPEMAANLSGGGFSYYNERPWFQHSAVRQYLRDFPQYPGFYKCASCQTYRRDLTFSRFIICAAVKVVATLTSPHKLSITKLL